LLVKERFLLGQVKFLGNGGIVTLDGWRLDGSSKVFDCLREAFVDGRDLPVRLQKVSACGVAFGGYACFELQCQLARSLKEVPEFGVVKDPRCALQTLSDLSDVCKVMSRFWLYLHRRVEYDRDLV
jgi:hypothetical protein